MMLESLQVETVLHLTEESSSSVLWRQACPEDSNEDLLDTCSHPGLCFNEQEKLISAIMTSLFSSGDCVEPGGLMMQL